jgi:drug/metabolite transporter (DMT)-like permease
MNPVALLLVCISAALHALWNYWAKRAGDSLSFLWGFSLVMPLFAGAAVLGEWLIFSRPPNFATWKLAILGGIIQAVYISCMGTGYNRGDLSVVYPVSRGLAPVVIAVLAWFLLHELPSAAGFVAIIVILLGTLILAYDLLRRPANTGTATRPASSVKFALFASVTIALYHIVDKAGAQGSSVLSYQFLMEVVIAIIIAALIIAKRRDAFRAEFRQHARLIFGASLLGYISYALVITAMMLESVAYVAAARNISILIGIGLGATRLREGTLSVRLLAGAFIVVGLFALAIGG